MSLIIFACKQSTTIPKEIKTAKDLIQYSIHHHDPKGNWSEFKSSVTFSTSFWKKDGSIDKSSSSVSFDNANQSFSSRSESNGIEIIGLVNPDTCFNAPTTEISAEQQEKIKRALGCDRITFMRDYYSYLVGMPMKLNDENAIINDTIFQRIYDGKKYDVVKVQYEPLDENPNWYFYFDKKDHSFQLCKFTSPEDENKGGEYIIYNDEFDWQGMKLKGQQVWLYNTATLDTLAVDDLNFGISEIL